MLSASEVESLVQWSGILEGKFSGSRPFIILQILEGSESLSFKIASLAKVNTVGYS
jgi:hypothetical protein